MLMFKKRENPLVMCCVPTRQGREQANGTGELKP